MEPVRPLSVHYSQFEVKYDNMRKRSRLADHTAEERELGRTNFHYTGRFHPNFLDPDHVRTFIHHVREVCGSPDVMVFDPIANIFTGDSENDNQQMAHFLRVMRWVRDQVNPDAALVLVHHASKMARQDRHEEPFNSFRGASALRGAYDAGLCIEKLSDESEVRKVWFELRNGPGIDPFKVEFRDGRFHRVEGPRGDERVAGRTQNDRFTAEAKRQARVIVDVLRHKAKLGAFYTASSFGRRFANQYELGSDRSIQRRIKEMLAKRVLGFFDAGLLGHDQAHHNSDGHLCCAGMVVADAQYGKTVDEAEGQVVRVQPDHYYDAATEQAEPVDGEMELVGVEQAYG